MTLTRSPLHRLNEKRAGGVTTATTAARAATASSLPYNTSATILDLHSHHLSLDDAILPSAFDADQPDAADSTTSSSSSPPPLPSSLDPYCTGATYVSYLLSPSSPTPLSSLTHLDLSNRYIKDSGCALLCEGLAQHPHIASLDLRSNDLHSASASHLCSLLSLPAAATSLHTLILEWNSLGSFSTPLSASSSSSCPSSSPSLFSSLHLNTTLTALDLRNNRLTPADGLALARLLCGNRALLTVDVRWNHIASPSSSSALRSALTFNSELQQLSLAGNGMDRASLESIEEMCKKNREGRASRRPAGQQEADSRQRQSGWAELQEELWRH